MRSMARIFSLQDRSDFDVSYIMAALEFAGRSDRLEAVREIVASKSPERIHFFRGLADEIIDALMAEDELCTKDTFSCENMSLIHLCEVQQRGSSMHIQDPALR